MTERIGQGPSRLTSRVLTVGAIVSAACLAFALVLELLGRPRTPGDLLDVTSIASAMAELRPWGWATLGVLTVIATPPLGLLATALELRGRQALLALAVLAILAVSVAIALFR